MSVKEVNEESKGLPTIIEVSVVETATNDV